MNLIDTPIGRLASSNDLLLEIAKFNIDGHYPVKKFYEVPALGAGVNTDAWDFGATLQTYVYTANAGADFYVASNNAGDTQSADFYVLDELFNIRQINLTLAGTTPVKVNDVINNTVVIGATTAFKCTRIYRIANRGTTDFAGTISCIEGNAFTDGVPDSNNDVRAVVLGSNNQTLMSHFTVPAGFHGQLMYIDSNVTRTTSATRLDVTFLKRQFGEVFRIQNLSGFLNTGSSKGFDKFILPDFIEPKSDIKIRFNSSAASTGADGFYILILIENKYVEAIGGKAILEAGAVTP
jgi:hypothetical protein